MGFINDILKLIGLTFKTAFKLLRWVFNKLSWIFKSINNYLVLSRNKKQDFKQFEDRIKERQMSYNNEVF